ncbi:hypothetical protein, conserved [Plasmodium gonderi]|uniref:Uncharacterized protein n=1 Tax=Plasmodium gonderi TaxID=77519 RepID=A0A1Y1JG81_PLAGO|nr:hypothetical protein, conserved [Plasmodium gonderi]GAW80217.1 hypothetical protein, conserved [Plasmodium gonderi]
MTIVPTYRSLIKLIKKEQHVLSSYLIRKRNVSYDTLAGIPWMSHSRITKTFERVSNEGPYDKITWEKLSERANKICDSFDIKEIGRILYAYSKVKYRDVKIIYKFIERIKNQDIKNMDLLGCAHICHSLNTLNYFDRKLFEMILSQFMRLPIGDNSFPLVITLNAFTKHCNDYRFRELTLKLLIFVLTNFDKYKKSCSPQGLAMILNSFSQVIKPSPAFLQNQNEKLEKIYIDEYVTQNQNDNHPVSSLRGRKIVSITHEMKLEEEGVEDVTKEEEPIRQSGKTGKNWTQNGARSGSKVARTSTSSSIPSVLDEKELDGEIFNFVHHESRVVENGYGTELVEEVTNKWQKNDTFVKHSSSSAMSEIDNKGKIVKRVERVKYKSEGNSNKCVGNMQEREYKLEEGTLDKYEQKVLLKNMFLKVLLEITKKIEKMNTQSLCLIINACCRIWFEIPKEFLKITYEETIKKIHLATIRHLSLIINGFIKLGVLDPTYLSVVFDEIEKKIHSCDEQQLSFILSSMVKLGETKKLEGDSMGIEASDVSGSALSDLSEKVTPTGSSVLPSTGSSVLPPTRSSGLSLSSPHVKKSTKEWNGGNKTQKKRLMDNLNAKFILLARNMNISILCNIMYCYAKLDITNEDIFEIFQIYFLKHFNQTNLHHLSLTSYVYAKRRILNDTTKMILNKSENILRKINTTLDVQTMKYVLMLVNSFSEINIYSHVFSSHLHFIIHQSTLKISDHNEGYHQEVFTKRRNNNAYPNTSLLNWDKMKSRGIYLSYRALSLYSNSIQGGNMCKE